MLPYSRLRRPNRCHGNMPRPFRGWQAFGMHSDWWTASAGAASDAPTTPTLLLPGMADKAKRRAFDGKSTQLVGAAAAGLEALLTGARRDVRPRRRDQIANWSRGSAASWWMSPASSSKTRPARRFRRSRVSAPLAPASVTAACCRPVRVGGEDQEIGRDPRAAHGGRRRPDRSQLCQTVRISSGDLNVPSSL